MIKLKNISLLLLLVFFLSFTVAVPPVTTVDNFADGYEPLEAQQSYIKAGEDFQYHFMVLNNSNGVELNDSYIDCNFFLQNLQGNILMTIAAEYETGYWEVNISGDLVEDISQYAYSVICSDGHGGALAGTFETTLTGMGGDNMGYLLFGPLAGIILLFLISLTVKNWKLKAFCHLIALLLLVLLINMSGLLFVNSEQTKTLWEVTLTTSIVIFLVWFLYIAIFYTIEIFNKIKQKKNKVWNPY